MSCIYRGGKEPAVRKETYSHLVNDSRKAMIRNPGLLFERYAIHHKPEERTSHLKDVIECKPSAEYNKAFEAWKSTCENLSNSLVVSATTTSPLVVGLGSTTLYEVGFEFSRPYGMPRIPGSAIKGAMRRAAAEGLGLSSILGRKTVIKGKEQEVYRPDLSREEVLRLFDDGDNRTTDAASAWLDAFGHRDAAGAFVIFDAWMKPTNQFLMLDTMTVHHSGYYGGKQNLPQESDEPNPVSYISIRHGVTFYFAIRAADKSWLEILKRLLLHVLQTQGLGAKTNSGYGRFDVEM
jgi:CRISPR-associated protein Cmr6